METCHENRRYCEHSIRDHDRFADFPGFNGHSERRSEIQPPA
jgi:hypothetical protein